MWLVDRSPRIRGRARSRSSRRARDCRGVSAIEYALVLSFISVAGVAAAESLGGTVAAKFDNITSLFSSDGDGSGAYDDNSDGNGKKSDGDKSQKGDKYKKGNKHEKGDGKSKGSDGKKSGGPKGKHKGSNKH